MKKFILITGIALIIFACTKEETAEQTESANTPANKEISYTVDTTTMKGFISYPQNQTGKRPGILVVHEWWGQNDYARMRTDMLAGLGYVAMAVDMYGNGETANEPQGAQKLAMSVMGNFETAKLRFEKALQVLKSDPQVDSLKIGAIGYCFGGSVVLSMVNAGVDLDAVTAFHAGLQLPVMPDSQVKTKLLICNGGADPLVSAEQITAYKKSMEDAGIQYKFVSYEGALHAFSNPAATETGKKFDLPVAYDEKADKASWEEMKQFFAGVF